ncbi:unnamed protein product, partial [Ixodes pacificus]
THTLTHRHCIPGESNTLSEPHGSRICHQRQANIYPGAKSLLGDSELIERVVIETDVSRCVSAVLARLIFSRPRNPTGSPEKGTRLCGPPYAVSTPVRPRFDPLINCTPRCSRSRRNIPSAASFLPARASCSAIPPLPWTRWTSTCGLFVADGRAGLCRVAPNTAIDVASNRHEEAPGVRVQERSRR